MTRSAAASPATRSMPPGPFPTSRRCCTTTRCWRAPTCTAGRSRARSGCAASAARRWTGRCGRCAGPRAASARRWTPTPRAWRASSTCGRWTSCWRRWAAPAWPERRWRTSAPTAEGNFEGSNVLEGRGPEPARLAEIQARLLEVRAERVRPGTDDKRLCSWNALMISALAEAGAALDRADYLRGGRRLRRVRARRDARRLGPSPPGCCAPGRTGAGTSTPIWRITPICWRRC